MTRLSVKHLIALLLVPAGGFLLAAGAHAVTLEEGPIRDVVIRHVQEKLKTLVHTDDRDFVRVEVVKVPAAPFDFPEAQSADEIRLSAESPLEETYSERSVVRVRMEGPGGHSREIGVPVQIAVRKPVWVVKNPIQAKEPLKASDFALETRNVSHTYAYAVGPERNLGQYQARVNMRPGEVLDARKILIPPDVRYNQELRIVLTSPNGMTVTVPGVALAEGRVGETIRVRQTVFQKRVFEARIIDQSRVQVDI